MAKIVLRLEGGLIEVISRTGPGLKSRYMTTIATTWTTSAPHKTRKGTRTCPMNFDGIEARVRKA